MYYIKWIHPFVKIPMLTPDQVKEWCTLSKAAFDARKWSDSKLSPAEVKVASNKITAARNEARETPEGQK